MKNPNINIDNGIKKDFRNLGMRRDIPIKSSDVMIVLDHNLTLHQFVKFSKMPC
jgi:hypothetical protein